MKPDTNDRIPLGKEIRHCRQYNPGHLFPVARLAGRKEIGIGAALPFIGADIWNAYEISWLNPKGKPEITMGKFVFPGNTPNLIESKSLKLYLNSLNQSRFDSIEAVQTTLERDLADSAGGRVAVTLIPAGRFCEAALVEPPGRCIDSLDIEFSRYAVDPGTLCTSAEVTAETVFSNLLRTNCPVTGQPDWGTVVITYTGRRIDPAGLLRYIVSYREHTGFHENCVERMFMDIATRCAPDRLLVEARFTRRGGLDINPWRANYDAASEHTRFARQ